MVEVRLLGPVEVRAGEQLVAVERPQQRLLVAALAVDAGRPVMVDTLIDRLWDEAPAEARRTLHVLITQLRRAFEQANTANAPVRVVRRAGGYVLDVAPEQVDLFRFRRLLARTRDTSQAGAGRPALLREALGLWRGEPLAGLGGQWAARTRQAFRQEHLEVVVSWAQAELDSGNPAVVVGPLTDLTNQHPFVESLTAILMRALCATSRSADALALYAETRQRLTDELGTDPGAALQAVHQQVLRGELDQPRTAGAAVKNTAPVVPRQLPAAVAHFSGRSAELVALTGLLNDGADDNETVVISVVGGTAGVGKTALAVHWAHQVTDRFPDGQLYVNLRGFDPSGPAMEPAEAMRRFLDALQVPPERIPVDLDAQAALYRSQLAERRMLVVLDNARDTSQVRPLLPGAPGCLVLVTSRNQLTSLIAAEAAHPITLDLLSENEARELLAQRIGAGRVLAEPAAVGEIIARCARLPLALALVAARAATHPQFSLDALGAELRIAQDRLDALTGDDVHSDVRAVFSWSYRTLSPEAARLFRLLGLHPGPDLSTPAAASLSGLPSRQVRPRLAELACANLITEHTPGRYAFHDLLRVYATDLAHTDTDQQRHAATRRMLDHYLHTAYLADGLLSPNRDPLDLAVPIHGATPEHLTDYGQALVWFTTEHAVLLAVVDHAGTTELHTHTWQLAWALGTYLYRQGHWHDLAHAGNAAAAIADRLAAPAVQANACRALVRAYTQLGRLDDAHAQLEQALDLAVQDGDLVEQARTHHALAYVLGRQGHYAEALQHAQQALDQFRAADRQVGQALALNSVGWYQAQLGNHLQAITCCQEALTLLQKLHERAGQADTWDSLGYAQHHLGEYAHAITSYHHALALNRDLGNRYQEAATLRRLGDTHHATGNPQGARDACQQALAILEDLHHPDAEQVRATLGQY